MVPPRGFEPRTARSPPPLGALCRRALIHGLHPCWARGEPPEGLHLQPGALPLSYGGGPALRGPASLGGVYLVCCWSPPRSCWVQRGRPWRALLPLTPATTISARPAEANAASTSRSPGSTRITTSPPP